MDTNELIQKAQAQITAKQREIEELRQFIGMCHKLQGEAIKLVATGTNGQVAAKATPVQPSFLHKAGPTKTKTQAAIDIVFDRYRVTGEPVPTRYVLEEMQKQGYGIESKYADSIIAGYLKSRNTLTAIRGKGWFPAAFS